MPTTGLYKTTPKSTASFIFETVIRLSKLELEESFDISAPTVSDGTSTVLSATDHVSATLQLDASFNIRAMIGF